MDRTKLEQYYCSVANLKEILKQGIINETDYVKAEEYLAKKYCIKKGNLYRSNNLIINDFRVIYVMPKKEVQHGCENNNEDKRITEIG